MALVKDRSGCKGVSAISSGYRNVCRCYNAISKKKRAGPLGNAEGLGYGACPAERQSKAVDGRKHTQVNGGYVERGRRGEQGQGDNMNKRKQKEIA
jgi:hypothetical protein